MRIIDKYKDFYDYVQNVYQDNSVTFDRTDSFVLTKKIMCEYMDHDRGMMERFVLLQVCNTFWLFLIDITKWTDYRTPEDYTIELISTWKNYSKPKALIKIDFIRFGWEISQYLAGQHFIRNGHWKYDRASIVKRSPDLRKAIDANQFKTVDSINGYYVCIGDRAKRDRVKKHIPILKECGMAGCIDPLDIYLALDEYFSLEKQEKERTESVGLTDKERIENHGFDVKTSFRGK